jgi:DNA topoisomerase VI subunit B
MLDFCSEKELTAQTGHQVEEWPLVLIKELCDNALDACEEASKPPVIAIDVRPAGDGMAITCTDNGPGLPEEVIGDILDFSIRGSSREAYVSPTRGAQGNALKTILAMPFVLHGESGVVEIDTQGTLHRITFAVDRIAQEPDIKHDRLPGTCKDGTSIRVFWPNSACSLLNDAAPRFLQIAGDYAWLNPHLKLSATWHGDIFEDGVARAFSEATNPAWTKWKPSDPTSPHWYSPDHLQRLVAAYITHDKRKGEAVRTVRAFVSEFRGLSSTGKQKAVLAQLGMERAPLTALVDGDRINQEAVSKLLKLMKAESKPVKPAMLGVIGKDHYRARFEALGCEMKSFDYRRALDTMDGIPCVYETAFAWRGEKSTERRRLVTGVNWSPGINNPFRQLGHIGRSLDTVLTSQRSGLGEPIILVLHAACARVQYTDRGKSAVVTI